MRLGLSHRVDETVGNDQLVSFKLEGYVHNLVRASPCWWNQASSLMRALSFSLFPRQAAVASTAIPPRFTTFFKQAVVVITSRQGTETVEVRSHVPSTVGLPRSS